MFVPALAEFGSIAFADICALTAAEAFVSISVKTFVILAASFWMNL
jgi:hypothetical protein